MFTQLFESEHSPLIFCGTVIINYISAQSGKIGQLVLVFFYEVNHQNGYVIHYGSVQGLDGYLYLLIFHWENNLKPLIVLWKVDEMLQSIRIIQLLHEMHLVSLLIA